MSFALLCRWSSASPACWWFLPFTFTYGSCLAYFWSACSRLDWILYCWTRFYTLWIDVFRVVPVLNIRRDFCFLGELSTGFWRLQGRRYEEITLKVTKSDENYCYIIQGSSQQWIFKYIHCSLPRLFMNCLSQTIPLFFIITHRVPDCLNWISIT